MKHIYQKPVITLDAGMAEGVYAASGAEVTGNASQITYSQPTVTSNWGNGGQATFTIDLSQLQNRSNLTIIISFNLDVTNVWGDGVSVSYSGKVATCTWYSAPTSVSLTAQVNGDITALKIESSTVSNN